MKRTTLILTMLALLFMLTFQIEACTCKSSSRQVNQEKVEDTALKFIVAKVISVKTRNRVRKRKLPWSKRSEVNVVKFRIEESLLRGKSKGKTIKILDPISLGSCGYGFQKGYKYLVCYLKSSRYKRGWQTTLCLPNYAIEHAQDAIAYLKKHS